MQNIHNYNIYKRARCYAAKIEATYLERGDNYLNLKPLTMIVILNDIPKYLNNSNILQNLVTVDNNYRDKNINLDLKFIFIFLPNLKNVSSTEIETNEFLQWLKFLEFKDKGVINNMAAKNSCIKKAKEEFEWLTAEQEEQNLKRFQDNAILEMKLNRGEWLEEGKILGRAEGRVEGRAEGESIGKLEAFIEMAKQMLNKKYSINEIVSLTGLSEKEILKLAKTI